MGQIVFRIEQEIPFYITGSVALVVTGGYPAKDLAEVIDLGSTNKESCNNLKYPHQVAFAASGFLGNTTLTICGGTDDFTKAINSCYKYTYDMDGNPRWEYLASMITARASHAIATLPDGSLWITGTAIKNTKLYNT